MSYVDVKQLYQWCKVPFDGLVGHPALKIPLRLVKNSEEMGEVMAWELIEDIKTAGREGKAIRAIVPCGPNAWYVPFARIVNTEKISLKHLTVFHMDECLDWEGKLLAKNDPYNFRTFMEKRFYDAIDPNLAVPRHQRFFPEPDKIEWMKQQISVEPIDITLGGWGQDGHLAYNQARRHPLSRITLDQLKNSEIRIQENNIDTILTLAHRSFGAAYQFVPPMSITLGMKECMSAKKIRVYSDTGAWKQTALRVALFSEETTEYPITLLQGHPDALITATCETARHPISENPEWEFRGINA